MLKRIIALFLVCVLAVPIFTVSASATANDAYEVPYVDLFDIGYWLVDGEASTNFNLLAGQTGTFDTTVWITTVELIYASSSPSVTLNGSTYTGTVTEASGVYSLKASISTKSGLTIGTSSGLSLMACKARLKGTAYSHPIFDVVTKIGSISHSASDQTDYLFTHEDTVAQPVEIKLTFQGSDLYASSFLDLDITTSEFQLTGIKVVNGTRALPYTTNSAVYEISGPDLEQDSTDVFFDNSLKLSVDTSSGFISAYNLYITLYGVLIAESDGNAMFNLRVNNVAACPDLSAPNPHTSLLAKVWNSVKSGFHNVTSAISSLIQESVAWFSNIKDEIVITRQDLINFLAEMFSGEDGPSPDGFNESMDGQETQFNDMVDTMETAPTIDLDGIEDVFQGDPTTDMDGNYLSLLAQFMSLEVVLTPLTIAILCSMLGYILYGKR